MFFQNFSAKKIKDFQEFSQKRIHIFVHILKNLADFILSVVDLPSLWKKHNTGQEAFVSRIYF